MVLHNRYFIMVSLQIIFKIVSFKTTKKGNSNVHTCNILQEFLHIYIKENKTFCTVYTT